MEAMHLAVGKCVVYLIVLVLAGIGGGGNSLFVRSPSDAPDPSPGTPAPGEYVDPLAGMPNKQGLWNIECPKADGVVDATKALFILTMLGLVAAAGAYVYLVVVAGKKREANVTGVIADVVLVLTMTTTLIMFVVILAHECTVTVFGIINDSLGNRDFGLGWGFTVYLVATIAVGLLSCFSCGMCCCASQGDAQAVVVVQQPPPQPVPLVHTGNAHFQMVPAHVPVAYPPPGHAPVAYPPPGHVPVAYPPLSVQVACPPPGNHAMATETPPTERCM